MNKGQRIAGSIQGDVLVLSRRRCCICFGLNRDDKIKTGQIAHLDRNPGNNALENLAFLCLLHHDKYDSRSSQSKGLTIEEVRKYRDELYAHFEKWNFRSSKEFMFNFLADTIDLETIAKAAIKMANSISFWGKDYAYQALTWKKFESCDGDIYAPFLNILDHFVSWGLLTYEIEEVEVSNGLNNVHLKIKHKPICKDIAKILENIK